MDVAENPYSPNAGAPPPALVGRQSLQEAFRVAAARIRARRSERSLLPTGLRGVGKTVLLNSFVNEARRQGYLVAQLEASDAGDFMARLGAELRAVLFTLNANARAADFARRALRVFKSFTVRVGLEGLALDLGIDAERGVADSGDLGVDVTALLLSIGEAALEQNTAVLIAVDEVQYLSEAELAAIIMAIHRITQLQLPVLFVGTGLPQLPALAGNAKSYSERLFTFPRIGALEADDAREAIEAPARDAGVVFTPEALDRIYAVTQGYPYFIQEWAYHVWNAAQASPITIYDVNAVEQRVLDALDENFFRVRYDRLTPRERAYLRSMAQLGPGPHRSGDVAEVMGRTVESLAPLRGSLIRKGMIYSPAHGDTAFTVPLFDGFMRRAIPKLADVL
jgi:hypothetical protein